MAVPHSRTTRKSSPGSTFGTWTSMVPRRMLKLVARGADVSVRCALGTMIQSHTIQERSVAFPQVNLAVGVGYLLRGIGDIPRNEV